MKKIIAALSTTALLVSIFALAPSSNATGASTTYWATSATATTEYSNGWRAELAIGAPDAQTCDDETEQAWTYGSPWTGSQLTVEYAEPALGDELVVYFSYDLVDNLRIEIQYEGSQDFYLFSDVSEDYSCSEHADSEYPNDIKVTRSLAGSSPITAIRFTVLTEESYPEIDAVGVVATAPTAPVKKKNPTITGTAKIGKTLSLNPFAMSWEGTPRPNLSYQWFACDKSGTNTPSTKPADCNLIKNADEISFKLKAAQKGKFIRARVKAENSAGSVLAFSKTTAKVS
jgi:hypothetical protein